MIGYFRSQYNVEYTGRVGCRTGAAGDTGIDYHHRMEILYERKGSYSRIDLAYTAFAGHNIMPGECAGVKGETIHCDFAHICHKRKQKRQLFVHGHYYTYFHMYVALLDL